MATEKIGPPTSARRPILERIGPLEGWALTLYEACDIRCTYCITGVQGESVPRYSRGEVREQIRHELRSIPPDARITVGALCDAYPRAEAVHGVAREALSELVAQRRLSHIVTKGATILRDVDLLVGYQGAKVIVSLCSHDDALLRTVDPKAPPVAERLAMVRTLDDAGIDVEVAAAPWIPGITDAAALLELVPDHIPVRFTALRVADTHVVDTPFGRRHDQRAVNAAYVAARASVAERDNVYWSQPPAADGAPPHIAVLLGRRRATADLAPAPTRQVAFFLHVMKTGGSTLHRQLSDVYRLSTRYPCGQIDPDLEDAYVDVDRLLRLPAQRRDEVRLYSGHFPFAVIELLALDPPPVSMTVLRDPVDRTISLLRQVRRLDPGRRGASLEELYDDPWLQCWFLHEHQTRLFSARPEEVLVLSRATGDEPELGEPSALEPDALERAMANLEAVDLVGVTEHLDDLVDRIERRLDIRLPRLPRVNVSADDPPASRALRERIRADLPCDTQLHARARALAGF